jgi:hypothetical protein
VGQLNPIYSPQSHREHRVKGNFLTGSTGFVGF